jgi:hypothetical protein
MSTLGNIVFNPMPDQLQQDSGSPAVDVMAPPDQAAQPVASQPTATPNYPASPDQGGPIPTPSTASPAAGGSRLLAILGAISKVGSTALAGVPDRGRPSFVTGLGEGARAEQAAQATQQNIKFRDIDSQIRLAELHNQDIKMQNDTQAQTDAHTKAEIENRALANDYGIDYDTIANHGPAVLDHLAAQTAATGAASVPPGTHVSADGENIYIPKDTQRTRDGQKAMYTALAPALGLPALPQGAAFVPPKLMNIFTNKINGFALNGDPIKHEELPGVLGAAQAQRDNLAKNGGSPAQLQALDNMIGIYQANLDALDKHAASVKQQTKAAELAAENSPENQAAAAQGAGMKKGAEEKAAFPYQLELAKQKASQKADTTNLDSVAFDPTYKNPDGTLGANVVMSKDDAKAQGLTHYKVDPSTINTVVAGMNDVQTKLNQLAEVANDRQKMAQVDPGQAAAMLAHGKGITFTFGAHGSGASGGVGIDISRINEDIYGHDVKNANQATRDFVAAYIGAHEAITQLPRLQTFGKSNRMTQQQMEAAQNLLPQPGDREFASQKMTSLQGMIDPLRKQIPRMPGAEQIPSWRETQQTQQRQAPGPTASMGSNLGQWVSGLQPK